MFLGKRKSRDSDEDLASLPDDVKKKNKRGETGSEEEEAIIHQIASLEDMVGRRTQDLEKAKDQLRGLYLSRNDSGENEAMTEAEIKAEMLLTEPNKSVHRTPVIDEDRNEEEIMVAEIKTDSITASGPGKEKTEPPASPVAKESAGDASDDFFSEEEDEENRLAGLIAALPDVTIDELLSEAEEIKSLVREWVQEERE